MQTDNPKIRVMSFYMRGTEIWLRCILDGKIRDVKETDMPKNTDAFDASLDVNGYWMKEDGGRVPELYRLMRKDITVCEFVILRDEAGSLVGMEITDVLDALRMPVAIQNGCSLHNFMKGRFIPKNREHVDKVLASFSTSGIVDLGTIIEGTKALSLNDDFWVAKYTESIKWKSVNLYSNHFNTVLSEIAFTGHGSFYLEGFRSSPEYTTNGMLSKAWRRIDDVVYLYKAGTSGGANTGNEPYSEVFAAQVAKHLDLPHVPYTLDMWKKRLCSACPLFTSEDVSYIPAKYYFTGKSLLAHMQGMDRDSQLYQSMADMLAFDAAIGNTDRHMGNFGVLQDNDTLEIYPVLAPIFDNGLSLGCYVMENDDADTEYHNVFRFFSDVANIELVKSFITPRQKELLRKLLSFKLKPLELNSPPEWRMKMMNQMIQKRVHALLTGDSTSGQLTRSNSFQKNNS